MIRFHLCTISFRHHLVSLPELSTWARRTGFDGVELWGVHARNLASSPTPSRDWLRELGLQIPMISDYLPLEGNEQQALRHTQAVCQLAHYWGATKVRTFAGIQPSAALTTSQRGEIVRRLRRLADCVSAQGLTLVVETHPGTLADTVESTLALMRDVDHPCLGLNFDALHVWESGAEPTEALTHMAPWVRHFHLKNIARRDQLGVFAPTNVYSPAGDRDGMVPVMEGACDYGGLLEALAHWPEEESMDVSLEWFGPDCHDILARDLQRLRSHLTSYSSRHHQPAACH